MAKKLTLRQQIEERDALLLKALETNEAFAKQNQEIRVAANNAAAKAKELGESVALFKQEALQAAVREAELRGYIQRTMEDDAVREAGPVMAAEPVPDCRQLPGNIPDTYVPSLRRTGPSSMAPGPYVPNPDWDGHNWNDGSSRCFTSAPPPPRHWIER